MAALRVAGPPVATLSAPHRLRRRASCGASRRSVVVQAAHTVTVEHRGKTHTLTLDDDTTILEAALDAGVDLPHDCKMGVCMTCPAKLVSGEVDQSGGSMLSDDVREAGFVLLCCGRPVGDCTVKTVPEEELLRMQLGR